MRILVVEDEKKVASFVRRALEAEQHVVDVVHDGATGLDRANEGDYDLVVLDVMLPGRDGIAILRALRAAGRNVPVLLPRKPGRERPGRGGGSSCQLSQDSASYGPLGGALAQAEGSAPRLAAR